MHLRHGVDRERSGFTCLAACRTGFILAAQGTFDTARVFAAILVLAVMGVLLFWLVAWGERVAIPWHASQKEYTPTA